MMAAAIVLDLWKYLRARFARWDTKNADEVPVPSARPRPEIFSAVANDDFDGDDFCENVLGLHEAAVTISTAK